RDSHTSRPAHHVFLALHLSSPTSAPTEIYTLSLHDALPISWWVPVDDTRHTQFTVVAVRGKTREQFDQYLQRQMQLRRQRDLDRDRKSTGLNSSHQIISYAVFCLKKKTNTTR